MPVEKHFVDVIDVSENQIVTEVLSGHILTVEGGPIPCIAVISIESLVLPLGRHVDILPLGIIKIPVSPQ
jgi:hypothetical protein